MPQLQLENVSLRRLNIAEMPINRRQDKYTMEHLAMEYYTVVKKIVVY